MSGNISIYGYDHGMLANRPISARTLAANRRELNSNMVKPHRRSRPRPKSFPLLQLPIELRDKILELVLPHTTCVGKRGIAWVRGHCAILATSRNLFNEGIRIMYGRNTFVIDVVWDKVTFAYQWLLPTGLIPRRTLAFPDKLGKRNVSYIRKLLIRIHHVDNYTGMIKHNFSGPGLRQGLRLQVEKLCRETLQDMYEISLLRIHFQNDSHTMSVDQQILEPLKQLTKTRILQLTGSVTPNVERALQAQLSDAYGRNSIFCLPLEIRERIYDLALPRSKAHLNQKPCRTDYCGKGSTELLRTCAMIYKEASEVMYRSRDFELYPVSDKGHYPRFLWMINPTTLVEFPEVLGFDLAPKVKNCVIHYTFHNPHASEKLWKEQIATLLEQIAQLLKYCPNITHLTVNFGGSSLGRPSYEKVRKEILRVSGSIKLELYGLFRDVVK